MEVIVLVITEVVDVAYKVITIAYSSSIKEIAYIIEVHSCGIILYFHCSKSKVHIKEIS